MIGCGIVEEHNLFHLGEGWWSLCIHYNQQGCLCQGGACNMGPQAQETQTFQDETIELDANNCILPWIKIDSCG